jgi:hypothetical protein
MDEAAGLLNEMLDRFLFESYTNSFYGLDSYLSLRARHESLSGQLRAPLEEEQIITQREEGTHECKANWYWLEKLMPNQWLAEQLIVKLMAFSSRFDRISKQFADTRLQIRTAEKPDGSFTYMVGQADLLLLTVEVRADSAFSLFIDSCPDIFWLNLEDSLDRVRDSIDTELRQEVATATSRLIDDLEEIRQIEPSVDELISAVRRAQTRLNQALVNLPLRQFLRNSLLLMKLST